MNNTRKVIDSYYWKTAALFKNKNVCNPLEKSDILTYLNKCVLLVFRYQISVDFLIILQLSIYPNSHVSISSQ